ncbi:hypothetical protein J6590_086033 [Homalodisca vitripennis]|nr:hypothetical protein J6590_086033 [Homalodisca vitripennis]
MTTPFGNPIERKELRRFHCTNKTSGQWFNLTPKILRYIPTSVTTIVVGLTGRGESGHFRGLPRRPPNDCRHPRRLRSNVREVRAGHSPPLGLLQRRVPESLPRSVATRTRDVVRATLRRDRPKRKGTGPVHNTRRPGHHRGRRKDTQTPRVSRRVQVPRPVELGS